MASNGTLLYKREENKAPDRETSEWFHACSSIDLSISQGSLIRKGSSARGMWVPYRNDRGSRVKIPAWNVSLVVHKLTLALSHTTSLAIRAPFCVKINWNTERSGKTLGNTHEPKRGDQTRFC